MSDFLKLAGVTHRGSMAGKVIDAQTRQPIGLATATILSGPSAFEPRLARLARVTTAEDGFWGFIDLPDGQYSVRIEAPPHLHYGPVTMSFSVQQSTTKPAIELIALPPTGVRGTVQDGDSLAPLPLARVRADGLNEIAYCDRSGQFVVTGVFPGDCKLFIGAIGYRRQTVSASMVIGNIVELGTIFLEPNGA